MVFDPLNAQEVSIKEAQNLLGKMVENKEQEKQDLDQVDFRETPHITKKVYDPNRDIVVEVPQYYSAGDVDFMIQTEVDKMKTSEFLGKFHFDDNKFTNEHPLLGSMGAVVPSAIDTIGGTIKNLSETAADYDFAREGEFKLIEMFEPVRGLLASDGMRDFGIKLTEVSDYVYDSIGLRRPEGKANQIAYDLGRMVPYTLGQIAALKRFKAMGAAGFALYMGAQERHGAIERIEAADKEFTQREKDKVANQVALTSFGLEFASPFLLLHLIKGSSSFKPIKRGLITEGLTEGLQTVSEESILKYHNANPNGWNDILSETVYSIGLGMAMGGSVGAGAVISNEVRRAFGTTPKLKEAGLSDEDIDIFYRHAENLYDHAEFKSTLENVISQEMAPENQHQRLQPEYQKLEESFKRSKNLDFFKALAYQRQDEAKRSFVSSYLLDMREAFDNMFSQDSVYLYSGIPFYRFTQELKKVRDKGAKVYEKIKTESELVQETLKQIKDVSRGVKQAAKEFGEKLGKDQRPNFNEKSPVIVSDFNFKKKTKEQSAKNNFGVIDPDFAKADTIFSAYFDAELKEGQEKEKIKELAEKAIVDIINNSKPFENKDDSEYITERIRENYKFLTPLDALFAKVDGDPSYKGPNFNNFKRPIDFAHNKYLSVASSEKAAFAEINKRLKINDESFKKIGIYAYANQKGGVAYLKKQGITDFEISNTHLNSREMEMYKYMRKRLDYLYDFLIDHGFNIPKVENYFPFYPNIKDVLGMSVGDQVKESLKAQASTPWKRREGQLPLELDAQQVFYRYFDQVYYASSMNPALEFISEIAKNQNFRNHVGEEHAQLVDEWIDLLSKKGHSTGDNKYDWVDAIRSNMSVAILGFKLSTAIVQPSALFDGSVAIGDYAFKGFRDVLLNEDVRQFLVDNFPEIEARVSTEELFVEMSSKKKLAKLRQMSFWALRKMDGLTAGGVAFGAYMRYLNDNGIEFDMENPNQSAIEYAQLVVRRTQSGTNIKDLPLGFTTGKWTGSSSINRLFLQFQTFALNRFSFLSYEGFEKWKESSPETKFLIMTGVMASVFYETAARGAAESIVKSIGEEEDEKKIDDFLADYFKNMASTVPLVPQAISLFHYGSVPIPALSFPQTFIRSGARRLKGEELETKAKALGDYLQLGMTVGGIPGQLQLKQLRRELGI